MKKIAWIAYGVIAAVFTLLAFVAELEGGSPFVAVISVIFTGIYLTGLYGYVYGKVFWRPSGWRFMFWLNIVALSIRSLLLLLSHSSELIFDAAFSVLFSVPMLYALYKYSSENNPLWANTRSNEEASLLSSLLSSKGVLETSNIQSTDNGDVKTVVRVESEEDEYRVHITRIANEQEEKFANYFESLQQVVHFLESNTPVRVGDFA